MLVLAGCNQQQGQNPQGSAPSSSAPAPASSAAGQQQAYTPPTADELYQMVAPIALFPDKLVAQVLAGSTYPDQITAAENLLAQNPNLKGDLLQAAVQPQGWDPSVKGLTQFPPVLSQMAQNIQWTTALGQAYANDPTDVLNAIQVMRQRAQAQGNLRSSAQQQVIVGSAQQVQQSEQESYAESDNAPPVYSGPEVVPPPTQIIQIEPAQSDTVYVPSYDPQTVYGGDMAVYPSYEYEQPSYTTGEVATVGAVAFGTAIVIGALLDRGGGWHSWGMNWGGGYRGGNNTGGGWHRPAVVYNNQTYVSHSNTVVNRYVTNNRTINNNVANNHNTFNRSDVHNAVSNNHAPAQPMNMPNFSRAGYPSASHAAPAARPEAAAHPGQTPRPNELPRSGAVHEQAPAHAVPAHPGGTPRTQEFSRQPASAVHRTAPATPHPQPAVNRPATHEQRPQPAVHAATPVHPQAAPHPAPSEEVRRPVQRAAPARSQQARPASHQSPPRKKDESH
ncbi:DUF3300 domain-containing protein [Dyella jejuensis]|uniref:DUF3300 domain-containing protein n=2 Tax=Dyella jejuensis TaxID=1432009 RepID=A0ABW8JN15_9GAMM